MIVLLKCWAWLKKCWAWIKKHWKWIVFPVGIVTVLASVLAATRKQEEIIIAPDPSHREDGWEAAVTLDAKLQEAAAKRDAALAKLRQENEARLRAVTEQQRKELEALQGKPIEEVVAWFNKL